MTVGGLAPMAVSTTHVALRNLSLKHHQAATSLEQVTYVRDLVTAHMIELKHDHVGLAAVHTWMLAQVVKHELPVARDVPHRVPPDAQLVRFRSRAVVPLLALSAR
jgi:hypothetical protein